MNLARVLAYKNEGLILSKKEGGEWAIKNVPEEYHSLIKAAMSEYADANDVSYEYDIAKQYAGYMLQEIQS